MARTASSSPRRRRIIARDASFASVKRFAALVLLFIVALSAANIFLMLSIDAVSRSLLFYVVAFVATPITMFVVSYFSITRRSISKSIIVALLSVCLMLVYRLALFPFYPSDSMIALSDRLPNCQSGSVALEVVYTWVNVTDAKWQDVASSFGCDVSWYKGSIGDADPFDALKYSMRSIVSHFPFVTKFLIVTERDQAPSWLISGDPMVQVVFHDEFMPSESAPVFNSNPTEYLLYKLQAKGFIKGNCFLYMNDDFIINKPIQMSDLVSSDGRIVFNTVTHVSLPNRGFVDLPFGAWDIEEPDSRASVTDPHVPYIINVAAFDAFMKKCSDTCKPYIESRCSRVGPLPMDSYQQFLAIEHSYLLEFVPPIRAFTMRLPIGTPALSPRMNKFLLNVLNPKFVFIDSHGGVEDNAEFVQLIKTYLGESFPDKSHWEV